MSAAPSIIALVILAYVATSVFGLALIKHAGEIFSLQFAVGAFSYGAGFLIWIFIIIRALPLSVAFPVSAGALIVGTQIAGYLFLKESLSGPHLVGVTLILAGIALISMGAGK